MQTTFDDTDALLRVEDVSRLLKLSRSKVYELTAAGRLKPIKIDNATRFTRDEIKRFLEEVAV